jgi:hypothetical protein
MANRLYNKQVSPKKYMGGGRVKKMGGGMTRKMYSAGSKNGNGKKFGAGDGVITPYEKKRGEAIKKAMMKQKGKKNGKAMS